MLTEHDLILIENKQTCSGVMVEPSGESSGSSSSSSPTSSRAKQVAWTSWEQGVVLSCFDILGSNLSLMKAYCGHLLQSCHNNDVKIKDCHRTLCHKKATISSLPLSVEEKKKLKKLSSSLKIISAQLKRAQSILPPSKKKKIVSQKSEDEGYESEDQEHTLTPIVEISISQNE